MNENDTDTIIDAINNFPYEEYKKLGYAVLNINREITEEELNGIAEMVKAFLREKYGINVLVTAYRYIVLVERERKRHYENWGVIIVAENITTLTCILMKVMSERSRLLYTGKPIRKE